MSETERLREALLPCPFCGGEPLLWTRASRRHVENDALIECESCGIELHGDTDEKAKHRWNTRPSPAEPIAVENARRRAALQKISDQTSDDLAGSIADAALAATPTAERGECPPMSDHREQGGK